MQIKYHNIKNKSNVNFWISNAELRTPNSELQTLKLVSAFPVNCFYDLKRFSAFLQARDRRPVQGDVFKKFLEFQRPGVVAVWELVNDRFRRPHFGEHFVVIKPFQPVTPPQAFDMELGMFKIDLKRKEVLPFRAANVEPGSFSFSSS